MVWCPQRMTGAADVRLVCGSASRDPTTTANQEVKPGTDAS